MITTSSDNFVQYRVDARVPEHSLSTSYTLFNKSRMGALGCWKTDKGREQGEGGYGPYLVRLSVQYGKLLVTLLDGGGGGGGG